jgi:hypothetical protein
MFEQLNMPLGTRFDDGGYIAEIRAAAPKCVQADRVKGPTPDDWDCRTGKTQKFLCGEFTVTVSRQKGPLVLLCHKLFGG